MGQSPREQGGQRTTQHGEARTMAEQTASSYDELPYDSKPRYATHPDCLATLATLLGMDPAPVPRCRVLELGCATGGNLIPMAATLPDSRFVGIDLSLRQIETGRAVIEDLGLKNIELQPLSILDVGEDFGRFDYILCHGVYSWVPPEVQDHILTVCKRNLAPQGVAYVSYNTYPGWHCRALVREMMGFHVRRFDDPYTRVQQARAFLDFLIRSSPDPESTYARLLKDEAELLRGNADTYVFHEHLEEVNHPLYFHEFMGRAAAKGLQFLGEAWIHTRLVSLAPEVQSTLRDLSEDLIQLEQYVDFLRNRTFRRTLLVHADVLLNRAPDPGTAARLQASALARPVGTLPDARSPDTAEFVTDAGITLSTNGPMVKALLLALYEAWPRPVPFEELLQRVRELLGLSLHADPVQGTHHHKALTEMLLQFYLTNVVALHSHVPPFVVAASERPVASRLARKQAETGVPVVSLRHAVVDLPVLDLFVLPLLDGSRGRAALLGRIGAAIQRGELKVEAQGESFLEVAEGRKRLEAALEHSLRRLARSALLVG
jgi:methyltransferase-like protein/cyclopropane fatty-acyl-phospholipid synthase-like methyltransferase